MGAQGIRLRCQQLLPNRQQCPRPTFRDGTLCRWHRIGREFQADFARREGLGRAFSNLLMLGCATTLAGPAAALWLYLQNPSSLWLLLAAWTGGWGLMLFADSVLALDYPLSRLALWPQLLALGTVAAILGGFAVGAWIASSPESVAALIDSALPGEADAFTTSFTAALGILSSAGLTELFLKRILFREIPHLRSVLWIAALVLAGGALRPVLKAYGVAPTPEQAEAFWSSVLGSKPFLTLGITWFLAFNVCEVVNLSIRRRECDEATFRATTWPSFPVCAVTPMVAMLASRLLFGALGVGTPVGFAVLAIGLCFPLCAAWTQWVVRLSAAAAR